MISAKMVKFPWLSPVSIQIQVVVAAAAAAASHFQ
jgi:hypothetical protein